MAAESGRIKDLHKFKSRHPHSEMDEQKVSSESHKLNMKNHTFHPLTDQHSKQNLSRQDSGIQKKTMTLPIEHVLTPTEDEPDSPSPGERECPISQLRFRMNAAEVIPENRNRIMKLLP
ncbi:hypothetical protein FHG87_002080, partial [Trinorchestia longiramus]